MRRTRRRFTRARDFAGYKGPAGWEAEAYGVSDLPWKYVEEFDSMKNKKMHIMIRDAGVAMARTVIEHDTASERLDAVEHWQATAIRPRTREYEAVRAANREFVETCNRLAREIVKTVNGRKKKILH